MIDPIRSSIWKSRVNSGLGILFLGVCALWAAVVIIQTAWHVNPVTQAFTKIIEREATLSN